MSRTVSPSAGRRYGLALVCRVWEVSRSSVYAVTSRESSPPPEPRRRGPKTNWSDVQLTELIKETITTSPWLGEGYRKVWAQLRFQDIRVCKRRVLRLMRLANLLSPSRSFKLAIVKAHQGRITTDRPDEMWGPDQTSTLTAEGQACIFIAYVAVECARERWSAKTEAAQGQDHLALGGGQAGAGPGRRNFGAPRPYEVWVTDIKYIRTREDLLYLGGVTDVFTRTIAGCMRDGGEPGDQAGRGCARDLTARSTVWPGACSRSTGSAAFVSPGECEPARSRSTAMPSTRRRLSAATSSAGTDVRTGITASRTSSS